MKIIDQALDDWVAEHPLPVDVQLDANRANFDLYYGPLYLDDDDEQVSCFDEGARQFDFCATCDRIGAALDDIVPGALYVEDWCGIAFDREPEGEEDEETGEWIEPGPYYLIERRRIIDAYVGSELGRHVA